jgi:hypothetical protein
MLIACTGEGVEPLAREGLDVKVTIRCTHGAEVVRGIPSQSDAYPHRVSPLY